VMFSDLIDTVWSLLAAKASVGSMVARGVPESSRRKLTFTGDPEVLATITVVRVAGSATTSVHVELV